MENFRYFMVVNCIGCELYWRCGVAVVGVGWLVGWLVGMCLVVVSPVLLVVFVV